jgi:Ni/Co efflux regulator RcnB
MSLHNISYNPQLKTTKSLMRMNLRLFPPQMDVERVIFTIQLYFVQILWKRGDYLRASIRQHGTMIKDSFSQILQTLLWTE